MKVRSVLAIWIFVTSLISLLVSASLISTTLGALPADHFSSFGSHVPAFSTTIATQAVGYPLLLRLLAGISALVAIYYWRSARPVETKTFAVTLVAATNLFCSAHFSLVVLVAYFTLPRLANGA